eukprot:TRINITY_DN11556_c0_g1_i1.p1 TRINITY_DN11556_c0_g1~~TRINITY_DN11556_c0_g1_i1.p1  ORF type:complete len:555 (+),score=47.29 TRINITY_DN11556_c0_g1_i1:134-1666(+)
MAAVVQGAVGIPRVRVECTRQFCEEAGSEGKPSKLSVTSWDAGDAAPRPHASHSPEARRPREIQRSRRATNSLGCDSGNEHAKRSDVCRDGLHFSRGKVSESGAPSLPAEVLEGRAAVDTEEAVAVLAAEREFLLRQVYELVYPSDARGTQRADASCVAGETPTGGPKRSAISQSTPPSSNENGARCGGGVAEVDGRIRAEKLLDLQAFQDILQNVIHTLLGEQEADDVMTAPALHNLSRDLWALGQANFETQRQLALKFQVAQDEFVKQVERGLQDTFGEEWDPTTSPTPPPRSVGQQALLPPQIDSTGTPPQSAQHGSHAQPLTARVMGSRKGSLGARMPRRAATPRGIHIFSPRTDVLRPPSNSPVDPQLPTAQASPQLHLHGCPPSPPSIAEAMPLRSPSANAPTTTDPDDAVSRLSRVVDQQARLVVREVQEHVATKAALHAAAQTVASLRGEIALQQQLLEKRIIDHHGDVSQHEPPKPRSGSFNFECRCSLAPLFSWMFPWGS